MEKEISTPSVIAKSSLPYNYSKTGRSSLVAEEFYEDVVAYTRSAPQLPPSRLTSVQSQKLEITGKKQVTAVLF